MKSSVFSTNYHIPTTQFTQTAGILKQQKTYPFSFQVKHPHRFT